ncbi:unnamed protein product [Cladocopium goreaui]|uniref:Uncharacterized protein n=1 Tax=Cladocopium goreaui TaxID=2562237 RepID=A0A9P1FLE8_9DINO|nr:unnamed protein product [Cladocopium goreaui]
MKYQTCSWQLRRFIQAGTRLQQSNWSLGARFARTSSSERPPDNPFPDFNNDPQKHPALPKRPVWDDDTEWEAALQKAQAVPSKKKLERSQLDDLGDFILSIAVRRKMTGYALLRFRDLLPLQFGIVDVSKHGPDEAQKKALEIAAALRDLREVAPQKLMQLAADGEEMDSLDEEMKNRQWKWIVALDDSTVDRGPPVNVRENKAQRTICMMQGLLIADCKRIFKSAPQVLNPRRSRQRLRVRGGPSPQVRKEIFEEACREVPDFPVVRHRTGTLKEDTYLMSDAWATARLAQRVVLLAQKREDPKLMARIREQARSPN